MHQRAWDSQKSRLVAFAATHVVNLETSTQTVALPVGEAEVLHAVSYQAHGTIARAAIVHAVETAVSPLAMSDSQSCGRQ